ncbi:hypothetical protein CsSME_00051963 [Camellia sinensis var. sinensis]
MNLLMSKRNLAPLVIGKKRSLSIEMTKQSSKPMSSSLPSTNATTKPPENAHVQHWLQSLPVGFNPNKTTRQRGPNSTGS